MANDPILDAIAGADAGVSDDDPILTAISGNGARSSKPAAKSAGDPILEAIQGGAVDEPVTPFATIPNPAGTLTERASKLGKTTLPLTPPKSPRPFDTTQIPVNVFTGTAQAPGMRTEEERAATGTIEAQPDVTLPGAHGVPLRLKPSDVSAMGSTFLPGLNPNANLQGNEPIVNPERGLIAPQNLLTEEEQKQHPILTGVGQLGEGLTTPENLFILAGTFGFGELPVGVRATLSAFFAAQAAKGANDTYQQGWDAYKRGDNQEAQRLWTLSAGNALFAGTAGAHAVREAGSAPVGPEPILPKGTISEPLAKDSAEALGERFARINQRVPTKRPFENEPPILPGRPEGPSPNPLSTEAALERERLAENAEPASFNVVDRRHVQPQAEQEQPPFYEVNPPAQSTSETTIATPTGSDTIAAPSGKLSKLIGGGNEQLAPESPATLKAQVDALANGTNPVVYFPKGTENVPAPPENATVTVVGGNKAGAGTYYHTDETTPAQIKAAVKKGTFGNLLGYVQGKEEATRGTPAAIVARDENGRELKAAVVDSSDPQVVAEQTRVLAQQFPNSKIGVEAIQDVIAGRGVHQSESSPKSAVELVSRATPPSEKQAAAGQAPLVQRFSPEVLEDARQELLAAHGLASSFEQPGRYFSAIGQNERPFIKESPKEGIRHGGSWYGVGSSRHIVADQFPWYGQIEQGPSRLGTLIEKGKGAEYERLLSKVAEHIQREKDSAAPVIAEFAPRLRELSDKIDGNDVDLSETLVQLANGDGRGFKNLREYISEKIDHAERANQFFDAVDDAAEEARQAGFAETPKSAGAVRPGEGGQVEPRAESAETAGAQGAVSREGSQTSQPSENSQANRLRTRVQERRQPRNAELRRRVSEMSPEEMRGELLTSKVTGLPNRRAFDEAGKAPAVAMSDADGLKALNDKFGYDAGNRLLKAKADALREAGLDAYHDKGDEFLYRGARPDELQQKLEQARSILRNKIIEVEKGDGSILRFKGADFSYGQGKDLGAAETALKTHKGTREARGERARGELRGIAEIGSEGREVNQGGGQQEAIGSNELYSGIHPKFLIEGARLLQRVWNDRVAQPLIEKVLKLGDKYSKAREVDPSVAEGLHLLDNAPTYLRTKATQVVNDVLGNLSRDQERLFVLMADADSRENLRENHPKEFAQAQNDQAIQAALAKYRPIERELTGLRAKMGGETLEQDYLRRVYDRYVAGVNKAEAPGTPERGTSAFDRVIRPQRTDKLTREATAEYHYQHGLHEFGPAFATKFIATHLKALRDGVAREFMEKATFLPAGASEPRFIEYGDKKYYRPDVAREMREAGSKNVQTYDRYDPTAGEKFPVPVDGKYLGPRELLKSLVDFGRREEGEPGALRRFFQEQILGFGFGVPHIFNIMRRVSQTVPLGAVNPQGWARAWKVVLSKELRTRGMSGLNDSTFDMLAKHGAISTGEVSNLKAYIGGNLNPANWARRMAQVGHKFLFEPTAAKGFGGLDQRARLYVADLVKSQRPDLTDVQIAEAVRTQLGDYNRANWTDQQRLLAKFMMFPGWDTSSIRWVIQHPIKTTVPPALVVLLANRVLNQFGVNRDEDRNDISSIHIGDRDYSTGLLRESVARNLFRPVLNFAQSKLRGESNQRALDAASRGITSGAGGLLGMLRPDLSGFLALATNRQGLFSSRQIVSPQDYATPGRVLPSMALEKQAVFTLRHAIPSLDRLLEGDESIDLGSFFGGNLGTPNYRDDAETRLHRNAAESNRVYQTVSRLAKTNPPKARDMLKDPDNAAYALFHNDLHQVTSALHKIDQVRAAVEASSIDVGEKKKRLAALDKARQMFVAHADSLNELLFQRRQALRSRVPTRPPGKASGPTAVPRTLNLDRTSPTVQ